MHAPRPGEQQSPSTNRSLPVLQPPEPAGRDDLEEMRFTLRAARFVFSQIDRSIRTRTGYVSRNTWLLEAITEKLSREVGKP
jgi:hypothetical protein